VISRANTNCACLYVLNSVLWCPLRFSHKICSHRLYHQLFVGGLMFYLHYLCLISHSGVQHILCCVFVLFSVVLCTLCYQFLWIIHLWLPFLYSLLFIKYHKNHVTIASGFQSKMNLKNIANLVSFLVSSHWNPSQENIGISRPPSTTNLLWIHIPAFWQVHIYFF
jgi:hypothetical protein